MTVLVTGGAGLIGMALRDRLAADGVAVLATDISDFGRPDRDLVRLALDDEGGLGALFEAHHIDAVIHCGAISGPMLAKEDPMLLVDVNIGGTGRLLDLARRHKARRFVFCSSISVYGDVGPGTITEATPLRPTSVYGATKVAGEALVDAFAIEHGLDGISLRIGRVYGPYRRGNCILGAMIRDHGAGRPTVVPCDPHFLYHYVHVDDVVEAMLAALSAPSLVARHYNVGGGEAMTMPQIAEIARGVLSGAQIELAPGKDDVPDVQTVFDIGAIDRDLGWRPRLPLTIGLSAYRDAIAAGRAVTG